MPRAVDLLIATVALTVLSPFLLIAAIAIKLGSRGPVIYRQRRVGRLLRRFSFDELPNLINVLRGEMAIVGPRPTIPAQVDDYTPRQSRRHEVLPGITGWAQVQGRAGIPWEERIELDVWYVDHRSFALDARILAKTLWLVLTGQGLAPD